VAVRDPRYKAELRKRAASMYRSGKTIAQIARLLGVNTARAYILCVEGGAKMRHRGPSS
jgi:transposase-like protein